MKTKISKIYMGALLVLALILGLAGSPQTALAADTLCVKSGGIDGCHSTIQAAIDAAGSGDMIYVYPGSYNETAENRTILADTPVQQGPHQFGLFFPSNKPGLSLIGVDSTGTPIMDPNSTSLPYITTNATNNFGPSGIWVEGDNVTVQGLHIGPNIPGENKTFEIVADGFTLKYSNFSIPGGGAIYPGDWLYDAGTGTSTIESYVIDHNVFDDGTLISISSGVGYSGDISGRVISNNIFAMAGADWPAISFSGSGTGVPWFAHPVGGALITGNSFSGSTQYIRSRGTVDEADFDWASYWNDNTFDKKVMAGPNPPAEPRGYTYMSGSYSMPNTKRIGSVIQAEIGNADPGDTVLVGAGTYTENVLVDKSVEIAGAGQGNTIVVPAVSNANPCTGSSMCGGAASNVFLVQANDVKMHDLTVDGDNPALTSGIVRGGADLDARNGIIKNTTGTFNNLEVYNTTVTNIYLRGIYSTGGTFNFHDNTVENVQGDYYSIAIFAWYGPGTMANNAVSYANDAISANHSKGIQFINNTVTHSGSGVHTDNAGDGGGTADLIQGNKVSDCAADGYGVWVFVPYIAPTVNNNTITNCSVGLSAWGQGAAVTTAFTNNTVNGPAGAAGSVGVYVTTDWISWGYSDISVTFTGNFISGNETGISLTADQQSWNPGTYAAKTITASFSKNSISNNTVGLEKGTSGTYNATAMPNWWGSATGPGPVGPGTGNTIAAGVPYTPWLCSGTDTSTDPGFQPLLNTICYTFTGFSQPIDMLATNIAKAGQTIPVKWRLTDANGLPVSDPASFIGLFSQNTACTVGATPDAIEEYVSGTSGLQYLGDGYWQFNWKTPKTWAGKCRTMYVEFQGGLTSGIVTFQFK